MKKRLASQIISLEELEIILQEQNINLYEVMDNFIEKFIVEVVPNEQLGMEIEGYIEEDIELEEKLLQNHGIDLRTEEAVYVFMESYKEDLKQALEVFLKSFNIKNIAYSYIISQIIEYVCNNDFLRVTMEDKIRTIEKAEWFKILPNELVETLKHTIVFCKDALNIQDKIGDDIYLVNALDISYREKPFVYLDGEIIFGNVKSSHMKTIDKYNQQQGNKDLELYKYHWMRYDKSSQEVTKNYKDVAYGHYSNGCAFIEDYMEGEATMEKVAQALLNQTEEKIQKIYNYNSEDEYATRIAKKSL